MRVYQFILNGVRPEACADTLKWAKWFQTADRHVAKTEVGECRVSTVFLGLDHNWSGKGAPVLFETMAFHPPIEKKIFGRWMKIREEISTRRYTTWEEAEKGHAEVVAELKTMLAKIETQAAQGLARIREKQ